MLRTDVDKHVNSLSSNTSTSQIVLTDCERVGGQDRKQIYLWKLSNESTALIGIKNNFLFKFLIQIQNADGRTS